MGYYNCGAYAHQSRVRTKKELKETLKSMPGAVYFDGTSLHGDGTPGYRGNEIPEGVILSVVGPDPFSKRVWYATVRRNGDSLKVT